MREVVMDIEYTVRVIIGAVTGAIVALMVGRAWQRHRGRKR